MRSQFVFRLVLLAIGAVMLLSTPTWYTGKAAGAVAPTCTFTILDKTMTLDADCTTDTSIIVPDGFTLDGAGRTITAVDPAGGHFVGGIVRNGGAVAHVTNVRITTCNLADVADGADGADGADNRLRGILFDGASGNITNNEVIDINQGASGAQEGNAIEVRNFGSSPKTIRVTIDGNTVSGYQKTGIVVNGDVDGMVSDNSVDGLGPVGYIARNGIQVGFGAKAMVKRNTVIGNGYTGTSTSTVSGGILVVGGDGYGGALCVGVQVVQNTLTDNDVGVFVSQLSAIGAAPGTATNIKVVNNIISKTGVSAVYQAGISDVGNNDKLINNSISGTGYDPANCGCAYSVDASPSFTNRVKVHANK